MEFTAGWSAVWGAPAILAPPTLPKTAAPPGQFQKAQAPRKRTGTWPAHLPRPAGPKGRPGGSVRSSHPPRSRPQASPTAKGGLLDVRVKNGFFNEKVERPEPRWVRSLADCWVLPFLVSLTRFSCYLAGATPPSGPFIPSEAWVLLKDI